MSNDISIDNEKDLKSLIASTIQTKFVWPIIVFILVSSGSGLYYFLSEVRANAADTAQNTARDRIDELIKVEKKLLDRLSKRIQEMDGSVDTCAQNVGGVQGKIDYLNTEHESFVIGHKRLKTGIRNDLHEIKKKIDDLNTLATTLSKSEKAKFANVIKELSEKKTVKALFDELASIKENSSDTILANSYISIATDDVEKKH